MFSVILPFTLTLSKGERKVFQQPVRVFLSSSGPPRNDVMITPMRRPHCRQGALRLRRSLRFGVELIADPVNGLDEVRFRSDRLDLLAQFFYVTVYCAFADEMVIVVNFFHNLKTSEYSSGVLDKKLQQLELYRRERQVASLEPRAIAMFIENEPVRLYGSPVASPAKDGLDPCDYFARTERLADIVVGAELKPEQAIDLLDPCSDDDNGNTGEGSDFPADVHAVKPRQHDVKQDEVGLVIPYPRHDLCPVVQGKRFITGRLEIVCQQRCELLFVLDDKDGFTHEVLPQPAG